MLDSIISDIPLQSQLIFGAIGTVAYSAFTNVDKDKTLGQDLGFIHTYSRGVGFLFFAIINFIGLIVLCSYVILNAYQINLGFFPKYLSFLVFYLAIWWILIMGLVDVYLKIRLGKKTGY